MSVVVYGIKNCDTVKKAHSWLDGEGIAYAFHDYKIAGVDPERLKAWCKEFGWESVLNRSGTTFRKLLESEKVNLDTDRAVKLMLAQPSMIRRPIVDLGMCRIIGFKPEIYREVFAKKD